MQPTLHFALRGRTKLKTSSNASGFRKKSSNYKPFSLGHRTQFKFLLTVGLNVGFTQTAPRLFRAIRKFQLLTK